MKNNIFTLFLLVTTLHVSYSQITSASFASAFQVPANNTPTDVQVVDMDGDGKKDLVVSNAGSNSVSVHRNIYSGGPFNASAFENAVYFTTQAPYGVAVGDIDGDGKPDIVVANHDDSISVLLNNSTPGVINSGSFLPDVSFGAPADYVYDIDLADFDGDGKPDIVFPSFGSQHMVSVYRNISTPGTVAMSSRYDRTIYSLGLNYPISVKVIDFDVDGKTDFMVGGRDDGWALFKNGCSPGFIDFPTTYGRNVPIGVDEGICDFGVGDFNLDGLPDVVMDFEQRYWSPNGCYMLMASNVYNVNDNMVLPQTNNQSSMMGGYTDPGFGVTAADLDLDGKPDIIKQHSTNIRVMRNVFTGVGGSITFTGNFYPSDGYGMSFNTGGTSNGVATTDITTGDLTGDGYPEIVLTSNYTNAVSILRSQIDSTKNITTGSIAPSLCIGGAVNVPYTVTGHFYGTNTFTAQLSDASGSFASPVNIGTLTSTFVSGTINATIPPGTPAGTGYRIRVISSTPVVVGADNAVDINITNSIATSVSIAVSPSNTICQFTSVTFTATGSGGGTPTYQWKVNGSNVGSNSPTYTTTGLQNNDNVTCAMTSSLSCAAPNPILSNTITMNVTTSPLTQPSSITGPSTACAFTSTTYSVPAVTGATSYTWTLPGGWTGTSTTNSITCTTGATGGTVSVVAVNSCTTSVARTLSVSVTFPPTASDAGPDQTICGTSVVLAANTPASGTGLWTTIAGGGSFSSTSNPNATVTNPNVGTNRYVWTITTSCAVSKDTVVIIRNASPTTANAGPDQNICGTSGTMAGNSPGTGTGLWTVVSGSGIFANPSAFNTTVTGLSNGPNVFQWTISNGICASSSDQVQITSNPVPVVVTNNDTTICPGNSVTLNATGASTYSWSPATNLNTTTGPTVISTPTATRTYTVTGTLGTCTAQDVVVVTLGTASTPAVSINASSTTICTGQPVNFTATPTNEGTAPVYQWKVNGSNVGTNLNTYSSSSLINGDVVTCEMISDKPCASPTTVTSNSINITVTPTVTPNISISTVGSVNICTGQNITFTSSISAGGTTPVYQWQLNGVNVGTNSASYSSSSWNNGDVVRCILTSNASCATSSIDTSNFITITVSTSMTASVTINASSTNICSGQNVTFFAAPVNGGSTPTYQWQVNGVNTGTNSPVLNTTSLANGNVVTCQMSSSAGCASPNPATSNPVFMTVTNSVTPAISINASGTTICAGTNVTFNASISGGGSSPGYQWQVNGNNVGTNSSTYSSTGLNDGDMVTCTLTSNAVCATPASVISNTVTITVANSGPPTISIAATNNPTCAGTTMFFTSSTTNAGATPTYDWKVNGSSVGVNTSAYNATGLNNGDVVTCVVTSSNLCAFPTTATSNSVNVIIQPVVVPAITITASQNPICTGDNVTFTTTISNGGTTPVYQWKVNGVNAGTNSPSFIPVSINNGDIVTCELSSNATCASPVTVVSNSVTMTVSSNVTPTISISTANTTVCAGATVTFSASITGGGPTPVYQWEVNGSSTGTNSPLFSTSSLNNGDIVTCVLTSSVACASPSTIVSNSVVMTVNNIVVPTVTITANDTTICSGQPVIFNAGITNGGSSPVYQWKINGVNAGTNSPAFNTSGLNDGDVITCELTSTATCPNPVTVISNSISIDVGSVNAPSISISADNNPVCNGTTVVFSSAITNGGSAPGYTWMINGSPIGTTTSSFSSNLLQDGDTITCMLVSNDACASPNNAISNFIVMTVLVQDPTVTINTTDSIICGNETTSFIATAGNLGTGTVYQWQVNGVNAGTNNSFFSPATLNHLDVITCNVSTDNTCGTGSALSNGITVTVHQQPVVEISANDTTPCLGDDITLNGSGAASYYWTVDGSTDSVYHATATTITNYILIGTNLDGCTDTMNISLSILSLPTIVATNDTSICPDNNVQLNANGGVSYLWTPSTGLSNTTIANPVATLNTSINYTVEVTGSNGCSNTENVLVTVIPCLGIDEEGINVNIYPNPFNEYFTIEGINEPTEVQLHNALGEVIKTWIISSENEIIETNDLRVGMYFLSFHIGNQTITKKIIKK